MPTRRPPDFWARSHTLQIAAVENGNATHERELTWKRWQGLPWKSKMMLSRDISLFLYSGRVDQGSRQMFTPALSTRRLIAFAALAFLSSSALADDVPWLAEVTSPPATIPAPAPELTPLLTNTAGAPLTAEEWPAKRAELRQAWLDFLGPIPQAADSLSLKTLNIEVLDDVTREMIEYEVEPGRRVQAYLLRPRTETSGRRPALVVFHGTTTETSKSVAGLGEFPHKAIALRLAERGFITICPANYLWEEKSYLAAVAAAKKRHPQSLGMATMLADGQRAVDVLLSLSDVDPQRIGAIGHSLGAKEVLYLMAFDDRVKAGVSSEGGVGLHSTNWEAPWYLGPGIKQSDFPRNHHELTAIIAPRPLLVLGGETGKGCADGDRSWPYLAVGNDVSRLLGATPRHGLLNHHEGHLLSPTTALKAFEWLMFYVAETPDQSPSLPAAPAVVK